MTGAKGKRKKRGFWRTMRIYFRRFRIAVWFVLLLLVVGVIYLNRTGLPDFIKKPLLKRLQARGLDVEFSRLRLRWYEGFVAEDVSFGQVVPNSPALTAREATLLLNWRALLNGSLQVDSIRMRGGRFTWPVSSSNEPPRELVLDQVQTELRFLPQDQWLLEQFQARFGNADIRINGSVTNATAIRDWPFRKDRKPPEAGRLQEQLRAFADVMDSIHFAQPPRFEMDIRGDARNLQSFTAWLSVRASEADTPWGNVTNGSFRIRTWPASLERDVRADVELDASGADTKWGTVNGFNLSMQLSSPDGVTNTVLGSLRLAAASADTPWATGANVSASATWQHNITNPVPMWARANASLEEARTRWGTARKARLDVQLASTNNSPVQPGPEWAWWTNLAPFSLDVDAHLWQVQSPNAEAAEAELKATWQTPQLTIHSLTASLYDGALKLSGGLNVDSRHANAVADLDLDIHRVEHLLTPGGRRWLSDYTWGTQPKASVVAQVVLPSWTNARPDWRAEVLPNLFLSGEFRLPQGVGYKGIQGLSAHSHFTYSNMTWHLPDLFVARPEGALRAEHRADDRTRNFYWKLHSTVDPRIVRPLLSTNELRGFDLVEWTTPPEIEAEVWGTFHKHEHLGAKARVNVTNVTFRGQEATEIHAGLAYTNKVLQVFHPVALRGTNRMQADGVTADFANERVYLTNAYGIADPLVVARAIGPKVGRYMEDYRFDRPVRGRAYGTIPLHGEMGADLHFDVDGGPFHWWKFNVPRISGHVHWKDEMLTLSDVKTDFYQGKAEGKAVFDVSDQPGTDFWFWMKGSNILLQELIGDLAAGTNHSEGWVDGMIAVTSANSSDWRTVQGYGELNLREGLLWDIPLFGVFSPILDGIMPGLGSSRATDGACTFLITNGVVRTADLDIRTATMRLQYRGDVDLAADYNLNARVEAELLKDMWLVGPLVSTVFWPVTKLFEYKVSGVLGEPKLEPVNLIPKLMLLPFHPLRILKGGGSSHSPPPEPSPR